MTRKLGRDPARRCLPLAEWPAPDRAIWEVALRLGDIFEPGGERVRHARGSNRAVEQGHGRWLGWLQHTGHWNAAAEPADLITPERVGAYLAALGCNSTATRLRRLVELSIMARLAAPDRDWRWIHQIASRVRQRHKPTRDKRPRLVGADDLVTLGHSLMREAAGTGLSPWRRPLLFRDGLAIALLAQRPLRRRNFAELRLGKHLQKRGNAWWMLIEGDETKTGVTIEMPWPADLTTALERYIAQWRPLLLDSRTTHARHLPGAGTALWVSAWGTAINPQALYDLVTRHTREAFGKAVNPHLFRDCVATSIAIEDPVHIGIASQILGHRSSSTTERYYNQARSIEAAHGWQATLDKLRQGGELGHGPSPTRRTTP